MLLLLMLSYLRLVFQLLLTVTTGLLWWFVEVRLLLRLPQRRLALSNIYVTRWRRSFAITVVTGVDPRVTMVLLAALP